MESRARPRRHQRRHAQAARGGDRQGNGRADVRERIAALGGEPFAGGPSEAAKFVDDQRQLWSKVVQERGIKPE
jgi:hypothetical protein